MLVNSSLYRNQVSTKNGKTSSLMLLYKHLATGANQLLSRLDLEAAFGYKDYSPVSMIHIYGELLAR